MTGHARPLFLDTTVLSNFASSESIDWLTTVLDGAVAVPAVRDELDRGREYGHRFLDPAVTELGEEIPLVTVDDGVPAPERAEIRDRLDSGEAQSLLGAIEREGGLATDDLAARRLAAQHDVPVTGSVGILAFGVRQESLDVSTASAWLAIWRNERGYYAPVERIEDALGDEE